MIRFNSSLINRVVIGTLTTVISTLLILSFTSCNNAEAQPTNTPVETVVQPQAKQTITEAKCAAITKAGTQCKRAASAGSSYCWQHGGTSANAASKTSASGVCGGATKAGGQCKNRTKDGGRCHLHKG